MATIIETQGSSYQKAGARLLLGEDGHHEGLLSGGCFENDLTEQAASVFSDGQPKEVFYDMRSADDAIWGLGLGCNGAVRVFMQRLVADEDYTPLNQVAALLNDHQSAVMLTVCDSSLPELPAGKTLFLDPENPALGLTDRVIEETLVRQGRHCWQEQQPELYRHTPGNQSVRIFYDIIKPPPNLLVIGAGPDAVPLTAFAAALGWEVKLVDHRPAYLKAEAFPEVQELLNIPPEMLGTSLDLNRYSALVLMTHSIEYDERYLKAIAPSAIPYIGLLGPAMRRDRLLESLGHLAELVSGRVFGPAGLDLGAETPEEIALAIVSEIQANLRQRDAQRLSQKDPYVPFQEASNWARS